MADDGAGVGGLRPNTGEAKKLGVSAFSRYPNSKKSIFFLVSICYEPGKLIISFLLA
jgi:hypothetical protein